MSAATGRAQPSIRARVSALNWSQLAEGLSERGFATSGPVLTAAECAALRRIYLRDHGFRKRVVMAQHNYGCGEYKYFGYPLPALVQALRATLYGQLADAANLWSRRLDKGLQFPAKLTEFTAACHADGQLRPTPLMLKYSAGDFNRLHQDLYGDRFFPFQAVILLNTPGEDFSGGEFVLVENRARCQSRVSVVPLGLGEMVIFAVNERADKGKLGYRRAVLRHGVSDIHRGERCTLGIIFHDAK